MARVYTTNVREILASHEKCANLTTRSSLSRRVCTTFPKRRLAAGRRRQSRQQRGKYKSPYDADFSLLSAFLPLVSFDFSAVFSAASCGLFGDCSADFSVDFSPEADAAAGLSAAAVLLVRFAAIVGRVEARIP